MMTMKKILSIIALSIAIVACGGKTNLETALIQAGGNRAELEKVLNHYAEDSLKYKAACFLIENMPYHYYYTGEEVDYEKQFFKMLHETTLSPEVIADSLNRGKMNEQFGKTELKYDIQEMDSAYLVRNIDWAFKVWHEQPWGKKVSFENFCEYMLPYRVGDECPVEWRERLYDKYNSLLDSIRLKPESVYPWIVVDAFTYIYRALGIPSGCDEMLMRGDNNVPHYWNFVPDDHCDAFFCSLLYPGPLIQSHTYDAPRGKVYRRMFSVNRDMMEMMNQPLEKIHPTFRYPLMQDVTDIYSDCEQTIHIPESRFLIRPEQDEVIYLCLPSHMEWVPVAVSKCKDGQVSFENVDGNAVFCLSVYRDKKLLPISVPFWVHKELKYFRYFGNGEEMEQVTILHKFNLFIEPFIDRMVGGVFEGSNDAGFRKKDTLYLIEEKPVRLYNVAYVDKSKGYRYLRYYGPAGSYCNISEVGFYGEMGDTIPLKGEVIGTPGSFDGDKGHWYMSAFDGDPYTSFDYKQPDGGWAGIDFGKPVSVGKIVFTPRNRVNFIRKGDKYELFYAGKGGWISAGTTVANSDSLVYNVPKGALLYLKNHSGGVDERIFECVDGEQVFW
jgi:hypothetical protein